MNRTVSASLIIVRSPLNIPVTKFHSAPRTCPCHCWRCIKKLSKKHLFAGHCFITFIIWSTNKLEERIIFMTWVNSFDESITNLVYHLNYLDYLRHIWSVAIVTCQDLIYQEMYWTWFIHKVFVGTYSCYFVNGIFKCCLYKFFLKFVDLKSSNSVTAKI